MRNVVAGLAGGTAGLATIAVAAWLLVVAGVPQQVATRVQRAAHRIAHAAVCATGSEGAPTWSPNGREIAFAAKGSCDIEIVVVRRDGGGRRVVSTAYAEWPDWSPKGILARNKDGFAVIDVGTGHTTLLRRDNGDIGAAWSPDGTRIAFTHGLYPNMGGDYEATLYVMRVHGGAPLRIVGHGCNPGEPAWSPDGRWLAVGCWDGIYVFPADGSGPGRRLVKDDFGFEPPKPSWSPDGSTIGWIEDETGIATVRSQGATHWTLLVPSRSYQADDTVSWSPNGRWITYSVSDGPDQGIYLARSNGHDARRIARY